MWPARWLDYMIYNTILKSYHHVLFFVDFITLYPHLDFKVDVDHNCRHLHIQSSMRPEVTVQTCTSGTKIFFSIIDTINFSGSTALTPEAQTLKRTFGQVSSRAPTGLVCRRGSSSPRRPSWSSHHWPPGSLHGLSPWRSPCWSTPWPPEWPTSRVTFQEKKSSKFGIPLLKTHSAAGDIPGKHFFCSCVSLSTWLLYESDNEWSKCTREANGHNDEIKDIQCGCVCF